MDAHTKARSKGFVGQVLKPMGTSLIGLGAAGLAYGGVALLANKWAAFGDKSWASPLVLVVAGHGLRYAYDPAGMAVIGAGGAIGGMAISVAMAEKKASTPATAATKGWADDTGDMPDSLPSGPNTMGTVDSVASEETPAALSMNI